MLLAICGSDTLTTVVSSTSMKVANITATATIQGFTCLSLTRDPCNAKCKSQNAN
jgi:hypothetical protein